MSEASYLLSHITGLSRGAMWSTRARAPTCLFLSCLLPLMYDGVGGLMTAVTLATGKLASPMEVNTFKEKALVIMGVQFREAIWVDL